MTSISNGESGSSVRTKLNLLFGDVETGTQQSLKLTRLKKALAVIKNTGSGVASVVVFGDSIARSFLPSDFEKQLYAEYGFRGAFALNVSFNSGPWTNTSGAEVVNGEHVSSPNNSVVRLSASGNYAWWTIGTLYPQAWNKATLIYRRKSGGGTFKFQSQTSLLHTVPTLWQDIHTYDTNNAADDLQVVTYTFTEASPENSVRAIYDSGGQCDIVGVMLENTANAGVVVSYMDRGGLDMSTVNTMPEANLATILDVLAPDLIIWSMKDGSTSAVVTPKLTAHQALWDTAYATEWLYITPYPDATAATETQARAQADPVIDHARLNGLEFFDTLKFIPSYAFGNDNGFFADVTHVNVLAKTTFMQSLVDATGLLPRSATRSRQGPGGTAHFDEVILGGFSAAGLIRSSASRDNVLGSGLLLPITTGRVHNATSMNASLSSGVTMVVWTRVPLAQSTLDQELMAIKPSPGGNQNNSLTMIVRNGLVRLIYRVSDTDTAIQQTASWVEWRKYAGQIIPIACRYDPNAAIGTGPWSVSVNGVLFPFNISNARDVVLSGNFFRVGSVINANRLNWELFAARLYNTAISDAELAALVIDGTSTTAPIIDWRFNEGSGTGVLDHSGNGWHGEVVGDWIRKSLDLGVPLAKTGATYTLVAGDNIIADRGTLHTATLPSAPKQGEAIEVVGLGAGGWRIAQPASTQIVTGAGTAVGTNATTAGTGGHLSSGARYDSVRLRCVVADTVTPSYVWAVENSSGTLAWV